MDRRILLSSAVFLIITAPLAYANVVATEAPVGDSVCLVCSSNVDCSGYADYSICLRGQCTSDRGLFGQGCTCESDDECATARCDGLFQRTCRPRKDIGGICNQNSDCKSDRCNTLFLCAEPVADSNSEIDFTTTSPEPNEGSDSGSQGGQSLSNTTTETTEKVPEVSIEDIINCKECKQDTECGEGFCVDKLCTNPSGVHPPFCVQCVSDDECNDNYYCNADGLIGHTGRKCRAKKRNGEGCNRRDECRSNHCNILWKCESTTPDQKRNPMSDTDVFGDGPSLVGILIWFCVAFAIFLFGFGSFIFCRKDGFRRTFGRQKTETSANDATIANTCDIGREVSEESSESGKPRLCGTCEKDDCTGCSAVPLGKICPSVESRKKPMKS